MTRFARAKGSKASNERKEEEATPWHVMRMQLAEQMLMSKSQPDGEKSAKLLKDEILKNQTANLSVVEVWSDFNESKVKNNEKTCSKQKKSTKLPKRSNNIISKPNNTAVHEEDIIQTQYAQSKGKNNLVSSKKKARLNPVGNTNSSQIDDKEILTKPKNIKQFEIEFPAQMSKKAGKIKRVNNEYMGGPENSERPTIDGGGKIKKRKMLESVEKPTKTKKSKKIVDKNLIKSNEIKKTSPVSPDPQKKTNSFKNYDSKLLKKGDRIPNVNENTKNNNQFENYYFNKQSHAQTIIANGRQIKIVKFEAFWIKEEDAVELRKLKKKLKAQKIPNDKIKAVMKLERRKAEKALAREKTNVCYHCRQFGHTFSKCPDINDSAMSRSGMCFKCGSLEHSYFDCKVTQAQEFRFATCFVCNEPGHIARQCPLNDKGQYPKGGSCHLCGEITHLRKDCPKALEEKPSSSYTVEKINRETQLEDVGDIGPKKKGNTVIKKKLVKF